jgi:hypothetical protein
LAVAVGLALGGCVAPRLPEALSELPFLPETRPVVAAGGSVRVTPPQGYCLDQGASHSDAGGAVLLIGRCSVLSGVDPAVITVTLGARGSARALEVPETDLAAYFASDDGRAALARSGRPADVRLREVRRVGQTIVLHLDDARAGETWRAMTAVADRLASVSVLPPGRTPLAPARARTLLDDTIDGLAPAAGGGEADALQQ